MRACVRACVRVCVCVCVCVCKREREREREGGGGGQDVTNGKVTHQKGKTANTREPRHSAMFTHAHGHTLTQTRVSTHEPSRQSLVVVTKP